MIVGHSLSILVSSKHFWRPIPSCACSTAQLWGNFRSETEICQFDTPIFPQEAELNPLPEDEAALAAAEEPEAAEEASLAADAVPAEA